MFKPPVLPTGGVSLTPLFITYQSNLATPVMTPLLHSAGCHPSSFYSVKKLYPFSLKSEPNNITALFQRGDEMLLTLFLNFMLSASTKICCLM